MVTGLSASTINNAEVFTDCEAHAFAMADLMWEATGDGFEAGRVFESAYEACEAQNSWF